MIDFTWSDLFLANAQQTNIYNRHTFFAAVKWHIFLICIMKIATGVTNSANQFLSGFFFLFSQMQLTLERWKYDNIFNYTETVILKKS